jgi:methyl-accepting chemotaxis protein
MNLTAKEVRMNITNMKIVHLFAALLAIVIAGFVVYGATSFKVLNDLKVNGPTYQRIVQGKDLIADILPPPEYVIESYLVALQMISATPTERAALVENLKSSKSDYETRHLFWISEHLDEALRQQIDAAEKQAADFYEVAFNRFIPAFKENDTTAAIAALDKMKESYVVHRIEIKKLVDMVSKRNETDEANAKMEINRSDLDHACHIARLVCAGYAFFSPRHA